MMVELSISYSIIIGILGVLVGIGGIVLSSYYYLKNKRTDEVSRGFYKAIALQAESILGELIDAEKIQNSSGFDKLMTKTSAIRRHVKNLTSTIETFVSTMWKEK